MSGALYSKLAKVLDSLPNGFPATESGVEINILKKIFRPEDIDLFMTAGYGFRGAQIGPMAVSDLGGLDTFLIVAQNLFPHLSDAKEPPMVLKNLVAAGKLGAKTGAGFYDYPPGVLRKKIKDRDRKLLQQMKLFKQSR